MRHRKVNDLSRITANKRQLCLHRSFCVTEVRVLPCAVDGPGNWLPREKQKVRAGIKPEHEEGGRWRRAQRGSCGERCPAAKSSPWCGRLKQWIRVPIGHAEQKESVPYQMLLLLEQMQHSKQRAVYPQELVRCLTVHNLKLFVQYDAAHLFLSLWNLIKNQITDRELADRLTTLYTIWVQEYLVCQKCSFETRRDSNMVTLPLPMFNARSQRLKTLEDSLHCFFQPEQLTDNNMCLCEQCERKTPSVQGMRLTCLPQTLTLHLKRFCYRKSSWTQKISYSLPFPQSLDFNQILTQEQFHPDAKEKADWQYDLFGVIAHSGLASFGHYCAYIRSLTEGRWYCFNDSSVCQVSWDDVKCTYGNSHFNWGETAYLLVYMRKNPQ
ncbi:ubl carboxyl-terminal hydrolase 18 isoform X2 [Chelonia mydas]|uniref:ubl carboxyl-terminal hydrolase 18 isoform X2 n=1 Tax=Chelonia mydas TaxID=8469 RepID=UPI001CA94E11|nr:ubl carboxyl-terminal hydrolase 18 isoform X2 [Chelonia mydas]